MNIVTYCDNGHLWDTKAGKPCRLCRKAELMRIRDRLATIEDGMSEMQDQLTAFIDELEGID